MSRKIVPKEENLLDDLNHIADYVIGNEAPEDVSYVERATLPESLSFAMIHPDSTRAVQDAIKKLKKLEKMIEALHVKLQLMETKNKLKEPKF